MSSFPWLELEAKMISLECLFPVTENTGESQDLFKPLSGETYSTWRRRKLISEVFEETPLEGETRFGLSFVRSRAFPFLGPIIGRGKRRKRRSVSPEAAAEKVGSNFYGDGGDARPMQFRRNSIDATEIANGNRERRGQVPVGPPWRGRTRRQR